MWKTTNYLHGRPGPCIPSNPCTFRWHSKDKLSLCHSDYSSSFTCPVIANFYTCFLLYCAQLLHPLTDLLSAKHTSASFNLTDDVLASFHATKVARAKATMLTRPCLMHPALLWGRFATKARRYMTPISFFSKKLQPAEFFNTFSTCTVLQHFWQKITRDILI